MQDNVRECFYEKQSNLTAVIATLTLTVLIAPTSEHVAYAAHRNPFSSIVSDVASIVGKVVSGVASTGKKAVAGTESAVAHVAQNVRKEVISGEGQAKNLGQAIKNLTPGHRRKTST